MEKKVFAIAAHPDDIEFGMAGTLILLKNAGFKISYMNIANGSCGSVDKDAESIARQRLQEAKNACKRIDAEFFPPLVKDIEIFYEKKLLSEIASIIRDVEPDILLVPAASDYMEDHMNAGRLAVTAAFCRNIPNFPVDPPRKYTQQELTVYHAQPAGNRDYLCRVSKPDFFINITGVMEEKTAMLAEHKSQKEWLDKSQGMDAYLENMKQFSREMGGISGSFEYAEGWTRHNHLGFCAKEKDPLPAILQALYKAA